MACFCRANSLRCSTRLHCYVASTENARGLRYVSVPGGCRAALWPGERKGRAEWLPSLGRQRRPKSVSRAFRVSARPRIWNTLPPSVRDCKLLPSFRRKLKTHRCLQSVFYRAIATQPHIRRDSYPQKLALTHLLTDLLKSVNVISLNTLR